MQEFAEQIQFIGVMALAASFANSQQREFMERNLESDYGWKS
jgi:hypothetical protein